MEMLKLISELEKRRTIIGKARDELRELVSEAEQLAESCDEAEHDLESETFKAREEKVSIDDYVFVGPRVIILPGVKVGKGAVIAAGAVVTKDVVENVIVGGIPAKEIGIRRNKDLKYRLGRARLFQ